MVSGIRPTLTHCHPCGRDGSIVLGLVLCWPFCIAWPPIPSLAGAPHQSISGSARILRLQPRKKPCGQRAPRGLVRMMAVRSHWSAITIHRVVALPRGSALLHASGPCPSSGATPRSCVRGGHVERREGIGSAGRSMPAMPASVQATRRGERPHAQVPLGPRLCKTNGRRERHLQSRLNPTSGPARSVAPKLSRELEAKKRASRGYEPRIARAPPSPELPLSPVPGFLPRPP